MKIGLIRHYAVQKPFPKGLVRQSEVLRWFEEYDQSADLKTTTINLENDWDRCYSSQLPRAVLTAKSIYQDGFQQSESFNEPNISPIFKKDFRLPFLIWGLIFRTAIMGNHKSQSARREILEHRVAKELDTILSSTEDNILIVSHALIMGIIAKRISELGFSGPRLGRPKHATLYTFER